MARRIYSWTSIVFPLASISSGEHIENWVQQCDVFLAMIGDQWLSSEYGQGEKKGQRRLDNREDFVHIEIQAALARGIPVVPILVGRAQVPRCQIYPPQLAHLSFRNAVELRSGAIYSAE